jgi:ABC-type phosphate transport system auxiliary subunit
MKQGFDPMLGVIGGGSLVLVLVSNLLATRRVDEDEVDQKRLPGEKYADREAPEPHKTAEAEIDGVPFSESKKVAGSTNGGDKRVQKLNKQLEKVNRELQRANVKLGLGEISEDGYEKIVERLKKRRAQLEDELNRHR